MGVHNGSHGHLGGTIHSVLVRVAQWRYRRRDIRLHWRICWILPSYLLYGRNSEHGPNDWRTIPLVYSQPDRIALMGTS
jgi:hypothetical protein